jgi:hypothetical protein
VISTTAAEAEAGAGRQDEEVDAFGGDVFAHLTGGDLEAGGAQLGVELGVDQVDLAQVRLRRVACDPRAVLDGDAGMGVAVNAETGDEADHRLVALAHCVAAAAADRQDRPGHALLSSIITADWRGPSAVSVSRIAKLCADSRSFWPRSVVEGGDEVRE